MTEHTSPKTTPQEIAETGRRFKEAAQFAAKAVAEMAAVVERSRRDDIRRRRRAAERAKR